MLQLLFPYHYEYERLLLYDLYHLDLLRHLLDIKTRQTLIVVSICFIVQGLGLT